jgi:hypothetical protein
LNYSKLIYFFPFDHVPDLKTDHGQTITKQKVTITYRLRTGSLIYDYASLIFQICQPWLGHGFLEEASGRSSEEN